jgi:hypothetical protein
MVPTIDPCDATGTYSKTDTTAGITLDPSTGLITVDYSTLPAGVYNFNVTFTASGSFTGSASYPVTISKFTIWTPSNLTNFSTKVKAWWDTSSPGNTILSDRITVIEGLHSGGEDLTDIISRGGFYLGSYNGKNIAIIGQKNLGCILSADVPQPANVFICGNFASAQAGNIYGFSNSPNSRFQLNFNISSSAFLIVNNDVSSTTIISDSEVRKINTAPAVYHILYNGLSSSINVDAGESFSSTSFNLGTSDIPFNSEGIAIGQRSITSSGESVAGQFFEFICTGSLTSDEVDLVVGYLANKWGTNSKLPASQPYRNAPPVL